MNRALVWPLIKLLVAGSVLIALLVLWASDMDVGFRALAAVSAVIVAGPVTLLVAIDVSLTLRRLPVGPVLRRVSMLPQVLLGVFACVGGVALLGLLLVTRSTTSPLQIVAGCIMVPCLLAYGISLLRDAPTAPPESSGDGPTSSRRRRLISGWRGTKR